MNNEMTLSTTELLNAFNQLNLGSSNNFVVPDDSDFSQIENSDVLLGIDAINSGKACILVIKSCRYLNHQRYLQKIASTSLTHKLEVFIAAEHDEILPEVIVPTTLNSLHVPSLPLLTLMGEITNFKCEIKSFDALLYMHQNSILEKLLDKGVKYLLISDVSNIERQSTVDLAFLGNHIRKNASMSTIVVRSQPVDDYGVVLSNGHLASIHVSREPELKYSDIGQHIINIETFINNVDKIKMTLHKRRRFVDKQIFYSIDREIQTLTELIETNFVLSDNDTLHRTLRSSTI